MRRLACIAPLIAALALPAAAASAGGTRTHRVQDFDDFDAGEADGAAIEASGRVTAGLAPARTEVTAASAFTCHAAGERAYVGTADPATILVVTPGKPGKAPKPAKDAKDAKDKAKPLPPGPKVEKLAAVCVLSEPQFDSGLVASVADGTKARTGVVDPLGAAIEPGPDLYFGVLRGLLASVKACAAPAS